jgi:peptide/nickel transport system permease protein
MSKAWVRFLRSKQALAGSAILVTVSLMALGAPFLVPYDPVEQHLLDRRQPPSVEHLFGLDELGRDNLSRVMYGARQSLQVGVTSVLLAVVIGAVMGGVAGYWGGWLDSLIMGCVEVILAFPVLLLAIAIVIVLGRGLTGAMYAVTLTSIPTYVRLVRVNVLTAKPRHYVLVAQSIGVPPIRLLWCHILPDCVGPLLAQATIGVGTAILETAGLGFLGLGAQPPIPEWGSMIGQGRGAVFAAPHIVFFPGLAILATVLGFGLLGNGLQEVFDPGLRPR